MPFCIESTDVDNALYCLHNVRIRSNCLIIEIELMEKAKVGYVYLGGSDEKKEGQWLWVGRQRQPQTEDVGIDLARQYKRWLGGNNVNAFHIIMNDFTSYFLSICHIMLSIIRKTTAGTHRRM